LLAILLLVSCWGVFDQSSRGARLDWDRPLEVALVLVEEQPLAPGTVEAFRERIPALETKLEAEFRKYDPGGPELPIRFFVYGPISAKPPPVPDPEAGVLGQLVDAVRRRVYTHRLDRLANSVPFGFDSRVYVVAKPPRSAKQCGIEGFGEQGGRQGFVRVELDRTMIDYSLFVIVHELFHTLGATDKYGVSGDTMYPDGFVAPNRVPVYPQPAADVMAHGRPIARGVDVLPHDLSHLGVGPATARELRWLAPTKD
jgi:hypothetical protein